MLAQTRHTPCADVASGRESWLEGGLDLVVRLSLPGWCEPRLRDMAASLSSQLDEPNVTWRITSKYGSCPQAVHGHKEVEKHQHVKKDLVMAHRSYDSIENASASFCLI